MSKADSSSFVCLGEVTIFCGTSLTFSCAIFLFVYVHRLTGLVRSSCICYNVDIFFICNTEVMSIILIIHIVKILESVILLSDFHSPVC